MSHPPAPPANPVLLHAWSLAREIMGRRLDLLRVPGLAAQAGFNGVEWLDRLMPSFEPAFWEELAAAQKEAGLTSAALSLSLDLTAAPGLVAAQKDRTKIILGLCPRLGVSAARVSVGGGGLSLARLILHTQLNAKRAGEPRPLNALGRGLYRLMLRLPARVHRASRQPEPLALQSVAWSLQPLARQAAGLGIRLGVENHFGLTSHPQSLLELLDLVAQEPGESLHERRDEGWAARSPQAGPGLGVCLDTGNWPLGVDPTAAARLLAPRAVLVHWKLQSQTPQDSERAHLAAQAQAIRLAGYQGMVSVEYEGPGSGLQGAQEGRRLWEELSRAAR